MNERAANLQLRMILNTINQVDKKRTVYGVEIIIRIQIIISQTA